MASSVTSKLPQPRSMEELENSSDDDALEDCCPWLDLSPCKYNCTTFPSLGNVLVDSKTTVPDRCDDSDESGEDNCATFDEKDEFAVDLGEEESDDEEKSVTLYSAAKLP